MKAFVIPLVICLSFASVVGIANGESNDGNTATSPTRHQVKMDTAEFLNTHTYDYFQDVWTLKSGVEPPTPRCQTTCRVSGVT